MIWMPPALGWTNEIRHCLVEAAPVLCPVCLQAQSGSELKNVLMWRSIERHTCERAHVRDSPIQKPDTDIRSIASIALGWA